MTNDFVSIPRNLFFNICWLKNTCLQANNIKKRSLGINIIIYCVLYLYCTLHLFVDCILCTVYFILYLLAVFQTTLYCTYWPCFRPFCFCRFVAWLCFKPSPCASVETILGVVFLGPSGPKTILGLVFRAPMAPKQS